MLIWLPARCWSICLPTACDIKKIPRKFTPIIWSYSSSLYSTAGLRWLMPATLTRVSIRPNCFMTDSTVSRITSPFATSQTRASTETDFSRDFFGRLFNCLRLTSGDCYLRPAFGKAAGDGVSDTAACTRDQYYLILNGKQGVGRGSMGHEEHSFQCKVVVIFSWNAMFSRPGRGETRQLIQTSV